MLRKFDRLARQSRFAGSTAEAFAVWRKETRTLLQKLLGLDKMELCPPQPVYMDGTVLTGESAGSIGAFRWNRKSL